MCIKPRSTATFEEEKVLEATIFLQSLKNLGVVIDTGEKEALREILSNGIERVSLHLVPYSMKGKDGELLVRPGTSFGRVLDDLYFDKAAVAVWRTLDHLVLSLLDARFSWLEEHPAAYPFTFSGMRERFLSFVREERKLAASSLGLESKTLESWLLAFSQVEAAILEGRGFLDQSFGTIEVFTEGPWNEEEDGIWNIALALDSLLLLNEHHADLSFTSWLLQISKDYGVEGRRLGIPAFFS